MKKSSGNKTDTAGFSPKMWAKGPTKSPAGKSMPMGNMKMGKTKGKGKCSTCS